MIPSPPFNYISSSSVLFSICLLLIQEACTIKIVQLKVPVYAPRNSSVRLECHFELEPGQGLQSVKWYKNGKEFYRYVPRDDPRKTVFAQPAFAIDLLNSSENSVVLTPLDHEASGRYKCEVTGEAPSFAVISSQKDMLVVDLPRKGPSIHGIKSRYSPGDNIQVECWAPWSKPAANLTWFINGELAEEQFLRQRPLQNDTEGLESVTLGLNFKLRLKYYKRGDLKIKCVATIGQLYSRSNEISIPAPTVEMKVPAMERRETLYSSVTGLPTKSAVSGAESPLNAVAVVALVCIVLIQPAALE